MKLLLETKNITKKYKESYAVKNINLNLYKQDIYGLVGKNGAGKTTLFKIIMGLIAPTSGKLIIQGKETQGDLNFARSNIGFMIGTTFFPYLNPFQNIEYYRKLKGIQDVNETNKVLKIVGLYGVKKTYKQFSLGMKQRLGLANALLGFPDIIILDEPINGLDPHGITDIRNIIIEMNQKYQITFIISSHILSELELVATRYGFIEQGQVLEEISNNELQRKLQRKLIIHVDNVDKATTLLETIFNINEYQVNDQQEIILTEMIENSALITNLFVENGINVYEIKKQKTTLENYYINLIGGV